MHNGITTSPVDARKQRFLDLLLPHRHRLAQYARAVSANREEADDLVGDTVLAALEGFDRLRDGDSFRGFLFTIASRLARRRNWRRKIFGPWDRERAEEIADHGARPDMAAEVEMLRAALRRLPDLQREAVVLFEITGLSLDDIRAIQGGTLSAVKSRVSRGRRRLAEILGAVDTSIERRADAPERSSALTFSSSVM